MTNERMPELGPTALDSFEVWDRNGRAPEGKGSPRAFVSLRPGGVVGINKDAWAMIGYRRSVKVMFDPERGRLGIIPADPDDDNAYKLDHWQAQLSCRALFDYYGVEITETRRCYALELVDGILVANVGKPE